MQNHPNYEDLMQMRRSSFSEAASAKKLHIMVANLKREFGSSTEIKIEDLKEKDFSEVVVFTSRNYSSRNPLCAMLHMTLEEIMELQEELVRERIGNKVSIIERDPSTERIVGSSIPNVLSKAQTNFCVSTTLNDKNSLKLQCFYHILETLKNSVNFFEKYKIDKILELSMGVVHPDYTGKGILNKITLESIKRGKDIGCQIVVAQATNTITQKQLKNLGFTEEFELDLSSTRIDGMMVLDLKRSLDTTSFKVFSQLL